MTQRGLPEPGELLAERYRIVRLIGEGGMGAVLEAENTLTQKRVAIKLLHPTLGQNSEAAQRLVREAQASCRIRHQNVVDVYDVVSAHGALFLIMELLEGEPLSSLLERGGVPAHEFIAIVLSAMRGVAAAHGVGVVHRDIHPGNILLAREPPNVELVPKVLDFGIAKIFDDSERLLTGSGVMMGTPLYMSYEQLCSARDIDARTDVYPFGVILYQGLTGQQPYQANTLTELLIKITSEPPPPPKQLAPNIPSALDRLICWALARDRAERVPSMQAFIDELEPFASARAFRTQMTDAQRTLPVLVPRGQVARIRAPVVELSALEPGPAPEQPESDSLAAPAPNAARSTPPPPADASKSTELKLLPLAFVAAATLAVMGTGTFVVRQFSRYNAKQRELVAPPPLPSVEVAPKTAAHVSPPSLPVAPRLILKKESVLDAAVAQPASPVSAPVAPLPEASSAPRAARAKSAAAQLPAKRRFRAGEARPSDF